MPFETVDDLLDEIAEAFPAVLFEELNGGVESGMAGPDNGDMTARERDAASLFFLHKKIRILLTELVAARIDRGDRSGIINDSLS
jgi:hypothetical protein